MIRIAVCTLGLLICHVSLAEDIVYTQSSAIQPSVAQGHDLHVLSPSAPAPLSHAEFGAGPVPNWIWGPDVATTYFVRTTFRADNIKAAILKSSCDNVGRLFLNGHVVASGRQWDRPMIVDVTEHLNAGENLLEAKITNDGGTAGFILKLAMRYSDDSVTHVVTDQSWKVDTQRDGAFEDTADVRAKLGDGPWGNIFASELKTSRVPEEVFELQAGFQAEKLFTVPKEELGSWVCITFDHKGRLLASDQGDKGICRLTLPPVGADGGETRVELLDFPDCDIQPRAAQGMLYAFDSLYFSINGGPGSGLYRARDTNDDDQFDECVLLKQLNGGGEHGPHALRLSPDGTRIFLIAGNHTDPPFEAGEDLENDDYSSRIPTNWGEDLLLPRMWDANGHARNRMAPGGWIASTDPDGKSWEIWSVGYRNPYDMAFNADGELFAYDADMEWDFGTPWYRPTRVVHATSGSEFGWRSGTGKWPAYYHDSLPSLVDVGPGSPVGMEFGYGLSFPAKYQRALYICDWTFGTMYAIHTTPAGSSYTAEKEEFVSRTPLPLTDVAVGPDGALYFIIGGRGTRSELYRITYVGEEAITPAILTNEAFAPERRMRRIVESFHGREFELHEFRDAFSNSAKDRLPLDKLNARGDRTIVTALRRAVQNKTLAAQLMDSFHDKGRSTNENLEAITALVRGVGRNGLDADEVRSLSVTILKQPCFDDLTTGEMLKYLRTTSLVLIRLGEPDSKERQVFLDQLDAEFPSTDPNLNRELCQILVYLKSPTVVAKTIELLKQESVGQDVDMEDLLARNSGYATAINSMIANQPDRNQVWYAFCLRVAEAGWTVDLRADYFRWFAKSQSWSGGHSFRKFLKNIENELWMRTSENERILIEAAGARAPFYEPKLPEPAGPGREWTLNEVRTIAEKGLMERDFDNGHKMYAASRCIVCHRFSGDGGATGPDLTQLAGRFNLRDLTEAIMEPGKVIGDQYKASSISTLDGQIVNGRIIAENETHFSVLTDPEDSTKVVDIAKGNIDETTQSATSLMPAGLLNRLSQQEVLDLLAFLLSRGDKRDLMFRQ